MKNASACEKNLRSLLKKLGPSTPPAFPELQDPVEVLVFSVLLWEATTEKAVAAYGKLCDAIVDFNDLRVTMPYEVERLIGSRYPKAADRCERLRATLRDLYAREHDVSLERLAGMGKRDVRTYVETLEGIVPYAAARTLLISFDIHAIPTDERLRTHLVESGVVDEAADVSEISSWLSRHIKANAAMSAHFSLQAWVDSLEGKPHRARQSTGTRKKPPTKKKPMVRKTTSKKKTSKKKNTSRAR